MISLKNTSNWWFKKHGGGPFIFASVLLQCWLISFSSSQLYITGKDPKKVLDGVLLKAFRLPSILDDYFMREFYELKKALRQQALKLINVNGSYFEIGFKWFTNSLKHLT